MAPMKKWILNWLVVTGTWLDYDFPYIGNFIVPTDELIFFRGVAPTNDSHHVRTLIHIIENRDSHFNPNDSNRGYPQLNEHWNGYLWVSYRVSDPVSQISITWTTFCQLVGAGITIPKPQIFCVNWHRHGVHHFELQVGRRKLIYLHWFFLHLRDACFKYFIMYIIHIFYILPSPCLRKHQRKPNNRPSQQPFDQPFGSCLYHPKLGIHVVLGRGYQVLSIACCSTRKKVRWACFLLYVMVKDSVYWCILPYWWMENDGNP